MMSQNLDKKREQFIMVSMDYRQRRDSFRGLINPRLRNV
jgi:hypothetical protein